MRYPMRVGWLRVGWLLSLWCDRAYGYPGYPTAACITAAAALLELRPPSSRSAVREAYHRKAKQCHPDVQVVPVGPAEFIRVTAAYELLIQPSVLDGWRNWNQQPASPAPQARADGRRADWSSPTAWGGDGSELHSRRVVAWRDYWQAAFQAGQADAQLQSVRARLEETMREVEAIRSQLSRPIAQPPPPPVRDELRARLARVSAQLAQLQSEVRPLADRAQVLRDRSVELERLAQQVA